MNEPPGDRKKGICAVHQRQPFPHSFSPLSRLALFCYLIAAIGSLAGCNSFGNSRLVKELQSENDRLLSEFRAQRDRATELEKANQVQAARLAESEKLLARLSQAGGTGRLSSLPQVGQFTPAVDPATIGPPSSGTAVSKLPTSNSLPAPAAQDELRWQPRPRSQ